MGVKEKIKKTLKKLGTSYTIIREAGNVTGEKLDYESNSQVTKPFIREHFLEVTFMYDTEVVPGDVLQFDEDQRKFLVMNADPELFKDVIITKSGVLYKCNTVGNLQRPSGESVNYTEVIHWNEVKSGVDALMTDKLYGTRMEDDVQYAQFGIKSLILYVPKSLGIAALDRWVLSGETFAFDDEQEQVMYKISHVERKSFPGVDIAYLEEENRE